MVRPTEAEGRKLTTATRCVDRALLVDEDKSLKPKLSRRDAECFGIWPSTARNFLSFRADELENLANGATELGQRLCRHRFDFGRETMFGNRPNLIHHGYPRLALAGDGNGNGRMGARG